MSTDKNNSHTGRPKSDDINVGNKDSSVSDFVRRPLPGRKEVKRFEEELHRRSREQKEERVKDSLSEIYQDDEGNMVNVKKIDKKKKGGVVFWFFTILFTLLILTGAGAAVFHYIYNGGASVTDIDFSIEGKKNVLTNQEFSYSIEYNNSGSTDLKNVRINVKYPDNFVMMDSSPEVSSREAQRDIWEIGNIPRGESGEIKITGRIISSPQTSGVISASMEYIPGNFSSEFQKEASFNTQIKGAGMETRINASDSVLVGEEDSIDIEFIPEEESYLQDFIFEIQKPENMEITGVAWSKDNEQNLSSSSLNQVEEGVWSVSGLKKNPQKLEIKYKFPEKNKQKENIKFLFRKRVPEKEEEYLFTEKEVEIEVIKSNLDLNLIMNGSQEDQPVNFGEELNYSLTYTNKGETAMENVMIMAVLESESLDWTTLETGAMPTEKGNTLIWSEEEISQLEKLDVGESGNIDFSINVSRFNGVENDKDYRVKSYAQFVAGGDDSLDLEGGATSTMDNKSNTIVNPINSDLRLNEEVRYFSEDNIPVGTGPLPPQVGEETTFKVYWTLKNNLHEVKNTSVTLELPDYVEWNEKEKTSVGTIDYNKDKHQVVWDVGRLPLSVYRADAEFGISLTPEEKDENKILVLSPGSTVAAEDTSTNATITVTTKAKTTKLEDDDIADRSSDGRVESGED